MTKPGRNQLCSCGSGRKFKKCCEEKEPRRSHTSGDRVTALTKLERFIEDTLAREDDEAFETFWGKWFERDEELDQQQDQLSDQVFDVWFAFDRPLDDGRLVVDTFLASERSLAAAERRLLEGLRQSSMRLYEVVDAVPGVSLTLQDLVEGGAVTVHEKSGSRSLNRFDCLAARIVQRGVSGQPEMEAGVIPIPRLLRDSVRSQLLAHRDSFLKERPGASLDAFYKELPPFFHAAWVSALFEPSIPALQNTDGEPLLLTRATFEVLDASALQKALEGGEMLEREHDSAWQWTGSSKGMAKVSLGRLELVGSRLVLEANSAQRAGRPSWPGRIVSRSRSRPGRRFRRRSTCPWIMAGASGMR